MTKEERIKNIDVCLRLANIQIHQTLLERVIAMIDLVDKKKNKTNIKDVINLLEKLKNEPEQSN